MLFAAVASAMRIFSYFKSKPVPMEDPSVTTRLPDVPNGMVYKIGETLQLELYMAVGKKVTKKFGWADVKVLEKDGNTYKVKFLTSPALTRMRDLCSRSTSNKRWLTVYQVNSDLDVHVDDLRAKPSSAFIDDRVFFA